MTPLPLPLPPLLLPPPLPSPPPSRRGHWGRVESNLIGSSPVRPRPRPELLWRRHRRSNITAGEMTGGDGALARESTPGRCATGTTRVRTRTTRRCCAASTSPWPSTSTRGSTASPLIPSILDHPPLWSHGIRRRNRVSYAVRTRGGAEL